MQLGSARSVERHDRITAVDYRAHEGEPVQIGVFGTSLTSRARWPTQLSDLLTRCSRDGVSVTVTGLAGANSSGGLQLIAGTGGNNFDVVLIEYAINDADFLDGIALSTSLSNHRHMIDELRGVNPGISIILLATNPILGVQKLKRPRLKTYYAALSDLADEERVSFFDGASRWSGEDMRRQNLPDGLHPDPSIEAELYSRPLARMIAASVGLTCQF